MSDPRPIRVVCLDDNEMVAAALKRRLEIDPGLTWAGWLPNAVDAEARLATLAPDVILMDIDIPGVDTFALVERLVAVNPAIRIIMLSGHVRPEYVERALDSGAWGYLSKNEDTARLIEGIRQATRSQIALSKEVEEVWRRAR